MARFRSLFLETFQIAQTLLATGQRMVPFAYEGALRVLYDAFTGRLDEALVTARTEAVLSGTETALSPFTPGSTATRPLRPPAPRGRAADGLRGRGWRSSLPAVQGRYPYLKSAYGPSSVRPRLTGS
ncbi:hypothetical protein ACU686_20820 [Yinghuangia aomiensis]